MQVFTAAFFICALVVASIDNAGFNVVLTGLLLCVWEVGAMWLLKRGPHETSVRVALSKPRRAYTSIYIYIYVLRCCWRVLRCCWQLVASGTPDACC